MTVLDVGPDGQQTLAGETTGIPEASARRAS
jgi:hypothetical protein